ncbi:MAG: TIGR03000 domain-containing protein [Planctomycetota bacterium]
MITRISLTGLPWVRYAAMVALAIGLANLSPNEVQANGSWGSHGSSGSFGSSGGSWGSRGGILNGRRPVRSLLNRIGNRVSGLGSSGGSYGSYGSRGGLLNRRGYGSFGSGGSSGGSYGYGSSGGYVSTTSPYSSTFIGNQLPAGSPVLATSQVAAPIETSYSAPAGGSFMLQQSYPVGDYGFQTGYPVQYSYPGGTVIGGSTIDGAFGGTMMGNPVQAGAATPGVAPDGTILDGGPIDSMLDPSSPTKPKYYDKGNVPNTDPPVADPNASPTPGVDENDSTRVMPIAPIETTTRNATTDRVVLKLAVPEDAKVFINDQPTRTPGTIRRFESTQLDADREYHYLVKAEIERNGKKLIRSRMVALQPGVDQNVTLDFDQPPVTTLALQVPENAKVTLSGESTTLTGKQRKFVTTGLKDGDTSRDYQIEVAYQVNGETVKDFKTIDLVAGDSRALTFGKKLGSKIVAAK